jgi:glycosyltransferase involved in cell wall biosynthesis
MNILHVVPTYLPARRYGGPIVAVHGLCKALALRGHRVEVFTTNVDGDGISNVPISTPVNLDGVGVRYFPAKLRRLYWSPTMRRALSDSMQSFDIVHTHSVFLWPTAAAAASARKHRVPYVIAPRGMLVKELISEKSTIAKRAWISLVERRNFKGAAAIHFTSEREVEDARDLRIPMPSPFIVPNGVDLVDTSDVERDDELILFLGRVSWKKCIDRLIEALPKITRGHLVVAGNDEEQLTPRLSELAERLGVHDRVQFVGAVTGDAKWRLLASAAVFVLPSISENFGNAALEAMAVGTPVVVTSGVGLARDVSRSGAGIVASAQPDELAKAITTFIDDAGARQQAGENARKLVEQQFTWEQVAASMEHQYERVRH